MGAGVRHFPATRFTGGNVDRAHRSYVAEGPLFHLKTRFINDNFAADEIGKPNALTALGVSLGLAVGFPLVTG